VGSNEKIWKTTVLPRSLAEFRRGLRRKEKVNGKGNGRRQSMERREKEIVGRSDNNPRNKYLITALYRFMYPQLVIAAKSFRSTNSTTAIY